MARILLPPLFTAVAAGLVICKEDGEEVTRGFWWWCGHVTMLIVLNTHSPMSVVGLAVSATGTKTREEKTSSSVAFRLLGAQSAAIYGIEGISVMLNVDFSFTILL